MFDVSSELSLSQAECPRLSPLLSVCPHVRVSARRHAHCPAGRPGEPLIGPLRGPRDALMTERGGAGWVQPAPAY